MSLVFIPIKNILHLGFKHKQTQMQSASLYYSGGKTQSSLCSVICPARTKL